MEEPRHRSRRNRKSRLGRKLLGLDVGERRVGVAVTDDLGLLAFPLTIVDLRRGQLADIARLAAEQRVDGIVVGLPTGMRGADGFQAREVRAAIAKLEPLLTAPLVYWDERLTSAIASQVLAGSGVSARDRRDKLDAIAASVMLQGYLDAHPLDPTVA